MMNESHSKEEISSDLQKEEKTVVEPANLDVVGSYPLQVLIQAIITPRFNKSNINL